MTPIKVSILLTDRDSVTGTRNGVINVGALALDVTGWRKLPGSSDVVQFEMTLPEVSDEWFEGYVNRLGSLVRSG